MKEIVHIPIMVEEILDFVRNSCEGIEHPIIIDGTLGEGGHTLAFLRSLPHATVIGCDRDPEMIERSTHRLKKEGIPVTTMDLSFASTPDRSDTTGFDFKPGALYTLNLSFSGAAEEFLKREIHPNFVLLDLGVSMYHFRGAERGFSYTDDSLDMRLSPDLEQTASDLINHADAEELANIFFTYGEERHSRKIASRIVEERPVENAKHLAQIIVSVCGSNKGKGIHPATRIFQALRIVVNRELEEAERAVEIYPSLLAPGGSFAVISFHSLEDRIVKNAFKAIGDKRPDPEKIHKMKDWKRKKESKVSPHSFYILTPSPVVPGESEVNKNPASRSAKLRVLQKKTETITR